MSDPCEQALSGDPVRAAAPTRLDAASVEALARRVVELMGELSAAARPRAQPRFVDAGALAAELGVKRSWVYAHREEFEHTRLGGGSKGRLRFDLQAAREASGVQSPPSSPAQIGEARKRSSRRRAAAAPVSRAGSVLAVRAARR